MKQSQHWKFYKNLRIMVSNAAHKERGKDILSSLTTELVVMRCEKIKAFKVLRKSPVTLFASIDDPNEINIYFCNIRATARL